MISGHHRNKIHKEQKMPPKSLPQGILHRQSPNQGSFVYLPRVKAKWGAAG